MYKYDYEYDIGIAGVIYSGIDGGLDLAGLDWLGR